MAKLSVPLKIRPEIGMATLTLTTLEQQSTWPTGIDCATCAARREVALETEDVLMYSV